MKPYQYRQSPPAIAALAAEAGFVQVTSNTTAKKSRPGEPLDWDQQRWLNEVWAHPDGVLLKLSYRNQGMPSLLKAELVYQLDATTNNGMGTPLGSSASFLWLDGTKQFVGAGTISTESFVTGEGNILVENLEKLRRTGSITPFSRWIPAHVKADLDESTWFAGDFGRAMSESRCEIEGLRKALREMCYRQDHHPLTRVRNQMADQVDPAFKDCHALIVQGYWNQGVEHIPSEEKAIIHDWLSAINFKTPLKYGKAQLSNGLDFLSVAFYGMKDDHVHTLVLSQLEAMDVFELQDWARQVDATGRTPGLHLLGAMAARREDSPSRKYALLLDSLLKFDALVLATEQVNAQGVAYASPLHIRKNNEPSSFNANGLSLRHTLGWITDRASKLHYLFEPPRWHLTRPTTAEEQRGAWSAMLKTAPQEMQRLFAAMNHAEMEMEVPKVERQAAGPRL